MWLDKENNNMILASGQSGGTAIHIINLDDPNWENGYKNIKDLGGLEEIINNEAAVKNSLNSFQKPNWESSQSVVLLHENVNNVNTDQFNTPIHLKQTWFTKIQDGDTWNRNGLANTKYRSF